MAKILPLNMTCWSNFLKVNLLRKLNSPVLPDGLLRLAETVQTLQANLPGSQTVWQPGNILLLQLDVFLVCLNPPSGCAAPFGKCAEFQGNVYIYQADPGNGSVTHVSTSY